MGRIKIEDARKYPTKIVVMSWNGKLGKVYELNNFIDFIIPDENQKVIYGGVFNFGTEVTEIHKYPML